MTEVQAGAVAEFLRDVGVDARREEVVINDRRAWGVRVTARGTDRSWCFSLDGTNTSGRGVEYVAGKPVGRLPLSIPVGNKGGQSPRGIAFGVLSCLATRMAKGATELQDHRRGTLASLRGSLGYPPIGGTSAKGT